MRVLSLSSQKTVHHCTVRKKQIMQYPQPCAYYESVIAPSLVRGATIDMTALIAVNFSFGIPSHQTFNNY